MQLIVAGRLKNVGLRPLIEKARLVRWLRTAIGRRIVSAFLGVNGEAVSDLLQGFEYRFIVNNAWDESYLGGTSDFGAWMAAPRTASFSMTVDLWAMPPFGGACKKWERASQRALRVILCQYSS